MCRKKQNLLSGIWPCPSTLAMPNKSTKNIGKSFKFIFYSVLNFKLPSSSVDISFKLRICFSSSHIARLFICESECALFEQFFNLNKLQLFQKTFLINRPRVSTKCPLRRKRVKILSIKLFDFAKKWEQNLEILWIKTH